MYSGPVPNAKQPTGEKEMHNTKPTENNKHSTNTIQIMNNTKCKNSDLRLNKQKGKCGRGGKASAHLS